jgi:hypothetical protein
VAYSRRPVAKLYQAWRRFEDASQRADHCAADILLLPLTGLMLTLWVLGTVPGASDAVANACATVCMP